MNDSLQHGGPDDGGVFVDDKNVLALGNRRLSILDLSSLGHQPMLTEDHNLAIVFNGEIYNFNDIKNELMNLGEKFLSHSDTEVILKAYKIWGNASLEKFRGMFAIAIWDKNQEELTLVRDRMGVKPLYYYMHDGLFMFASETRAFLQHPKFKKEISEEGLVSFLRFGYIPYPFSIWKHVHKVAPGCILKIDAHQKISTSTYWDIEQNYAKQLSHDFHTVTIDEASDQLEKILKESFALRMVSDVPVGVFLSGGIDSSIVAAILQKNSPVPLRTFTVGFDDREYNEAAYAKEISDYLHTDHTEIVCTEQDALNIVPQLSEIYDEPFGDSSSLPTFLISQMARKEVKVILSGDGGDEIFGGYDKYWRLAYLPFFKKSISIPHVLVKPFLGLFSGQKTYRLAKGLRMLISKTLKERFILATTAFFDEEITKMVDKNIHVEDALAYLRKNIHTEDTTSKLDVVSQWMVFDAQYYLPEDILTKVDRASMHTALEAREPLLDHKIIEFMSALPLRFKSDRKGGKYLLKKVLAKYLPEKYFDRPKHGFSIPMKKWLLGDLKPLVDTFLSEKNIKKVGILDVDYIIKFKKEFYSNNKGNEYKLWYLLSFQMWANRWFI